MKVVNNLIAYFLVIVLLVQLVPTAVFAVGDSFATFEEYEIDETLGDAAENNCRETLQKGKILFEETSLREETVKHFRMEDGSFLAVDYQQPIHYATADGIWNDIDNRLVATTKTASTAERYSSSIGDYKKTFAASLSDSLLFSVNDGEYEISMRLYEASPVGLIDDVNEDELSAEESGKRNEIPGTNNNESLPSDENDLEATNNAVSFEEMGDEALEDTAFTESPETSESDASTEENEGIPVARIVANEELSGEAKETATIAEQVALPHLSTSVIYEDALAGADLHYESIGYDIKESIIVKEPQDEYSFSFVLSLSNLSAEMLSDGSVSISDGEKQKFLIPAPYLLDASMTYSDDVGYSLTPIGKNEYLLTVTADAAWMNAENRSFPVQIDPTLYKVASNSTTTAITSSYIQSANPNNTSSGNTSFVYCGKSTSANASGSVMGALQSYFYVSNLPSLPANSRIIRSYLSLYHSGYHGSGELILRAFELTGTAPTGTTYSNWFKSFTWNNHSPRSSEMLDAVDLNSSTLYQYVNWDITKAVLKWYQNSSNNKGLTIEANDVMNLTAYASFGGYAHNASRPKLYVVYRNTVGVESYYDYQTQSMGQAGAGFVSDNSLQLTLVRTHFTSDSTVNSFSLTHVYNSAYGSKQFTDGNGMQTKNYSNMVLGAGWKMNVQETVRICNLADTTATYYVYCDADGTEHYFAYDSSAGKYKDEDGLNLSLTISGTTFTITDEKDNKRIFYNGYLSELRDSNGNSIYIAYNESSTHTLSDFNPNNTNWRPTSSSTNQITSIYRKNKDASIEWLASFSWDDFYRLFAVTDKIKNRSTFFNYTSSGNVVYLTGISVLSSSSYRARYVYDTSGSKCLKEAYDVEAKRGVEYKYIQPTTASGWQIQRIAEYYAPAYSGTKTYGATVSAEHPNPYQTKYRYYGDDRITFGDPTSAGLSATDDDLLSEVYFDALGRTVNTVSYNDADRARIIGGSVTGFTQNSGTSAKNNRIVAQAGSGMYFANMLKDSSFEACPVSLVDTPAPVWGLDHSSGYVTFHNDAPHSGSVYASLKINNTPTATSTYKAGIYQSVLLEQNQTYSFSAYIRIQSAGENWSYGSAYLYFANTAGNILSKSDAINFSTGDIEDGWMRIYVTYTAPSEGNYRIGVRLDNAKAFLGVDDMQLEVGNAPSSYNLLRDSSAEFYGTWSTYEGWTTSSGASIDTYSGTIDGSNAIQITGHTGLDRNAYQDVFVSENYRTTYILSGWAKANSLPFDAKAAYTSSERFFGLKARIFYTDNTTEDTFIPFNCYCGDWQYVSGVVVPKKTVAVSKIRVFADYNHNAGAAIFDDIALSKEPVQTYSYDNNGKLNASTDTGESMTYTYNGADLTQYIGSNGTFSFEYDNYHNVTKITNDGAYQEMTYDGAGNVLSSTLKNTTNNTYLQSSATYSNNNNTVASVTDVNGNTTSYNYTTGLLPESVTDAKNHKTTYDYNDDLRNSITRYYSTASSTSALTELQYSYARGILSELKRKTATSTWHHVILDTNEWGQTTTIKINKSSTGTENGTGITLVTNVYETNNGKLFSQMYGNGSGVEFSYDLLDRLVEARYYSSYNTATPVLTKTVYNIYNGQGFLFEIGTKNASGNITNKYLFERDSLGRLIRSIEFAYTYSGDVATCKLVQRTEHNYDTENRLTSQNWTISTKNYAENYTYSTADGSLTRMTAATGDTLNFSYDKLKRLQKVEVKDGGTYLFNTAYAYRTVSGNRSSAQVQYRNVRLGNSTDDSSIIEGKKYTYDALGNITMISQSTGSHYPLVAYQYDSQNQLTKETYYDGAGTGSNHVTKTFTYTYDKAGNIQSESVKIGNTTTTKTYGYGNGKWVDLLTTVGGSPIVYEGQTITYNSGTYTVSGTPTSGNPILYNNGNTELDLSWASGRQLSTVSCYAEQWQVAYSYDADGIRTEKNDDGVLHKYVTQNGKVVRETIGSGSTAKVLDFIYDESGRPFALNYSTNNGSSFTTYYYILNLQGDVVKLVNASGTSTFANYTYDAWGNLLSSSGSLASVNPLRYRGYYYDTETGWYYLQSRYYDPVIHRFINADSYASTDATDVISCNMYAYCNNNPVNASDPTGYDSSTDANGNGIPDYLEDRWKTLTNTWKQRQHKEEAAKQALEAQQVYVIFISEAEAKSYTECIPSFTSGKMTVYVVDMRYGNNGAKRNPDVQILNSYAITDSSLQRDICSYIQLYYGNHPSYNSPEWHRTVSSMVTEWNAHNDIYNLLPNERCRHVDLDLFDENTSYLGFWWRAVCDTICP
ncbi:MAG: hypothetical protein IJJ99_03165 [Oscillospiraceae bacterium]|nr:hypothetical protein [Oscillospiraceae bacterium]